ncbi:hypothetical protein FVB9288_02317 [Flavobacterium sp. CECT 9288]|nr:hypothetical protein FVB9288_02317 [Flavobacterium sp. CECT 9288]
MCNLKVNQNETKPRYLNTPLMKRAYSLSQKIQMYECK